MAGGEVHALPPLALRNSFLVGLGGTGEMEDGKGASRKGAKDAKKRGSQMTETFSFGFGRMPTFRR